MKKILWFIIIALAACSNEPTDENKNDNGSMDPTGTFIEKSAGKHKIAGVEYTIDGTTGDISVNGKVAYYYISVDDTQIKAVYSKTKENPTEYLGARVIIGAETKLFTLYLFDKVDFWATPEEVVILNKNVVGGLANDYFIKNTKSVTVTINHASPDPKTYNVLEFTGHLQAEGTTEIAYHYMGSFSDNEAYFRNADKKFFGVSVVDGAFKTFKKERLNFWDNTTDIKFTLEHEIAGDPVTLGVVWKELSKLPGTKSAFATLSFGDNIWLVGGLGIFTYKSEDQGETWKTIGASGLKDLGNATGVAISDTVLFVATVKNVYKSTDAGKKWASVHEITGIPATPDYAGSGFKAVQITDSDNSVAVPNGIYFIGHRTMVVSTDDGNTWTTIPMISHFSDREIFGMGVAAHKSTLYVMGGWAGNDIQKSTDGGKNWTMIPSATWPAGRDRLVVVGSPDFIYQIGWKNANDVWKAPANNPNTWELVTQNAGYSLRDTAGAIYFPAKNGGHKERLLLIGGRNGDNSVWRSESEQ